MSKAATGKQIYQDTKNENVGFLSSSQCVIESSFFRLPNLFYLESPKYKKEILGTSAWRVGIGCTRHKVRKKASAEISKLIYGAYEIWTWDARPNLITVGATVVSCTMISGR